VREKRKKGEIDKNLSVERKRMRKREKAIKINRDQEIDKDREKAGLKRERESDHNLFTNEALQTLWPLLLLLRMLLCMLL